MKKTTFVRRFLIKLLHWEYWDSYILYLPLYPYWLWLSLKARSVFFLCAANPTIKNGGFIMETKMDTYRQLPEALYPKTLPIQPHADFFTIQSALQQAGIQYPIIAKPDIGEKGLGVAKINDENALRQYIQKMPFPFLIQEFVNYTYEAGIFYVRMPGADTGEITGIVTKIMPGVTGNGKDSVQVLASRMSRYVLQWKQISTLDKDILQYIPQPGEKVNLLSYGNHARGALFIDETYKNTTALTQTIDAICRQMPEFYYGRLDIKFADWQCLAQGKEISIIEVNGSGSGPTHIYDPGHSLLFAWTEIIRHWKMLYTISTANHKRGVPYPGFVQCMRDIRTFRTMAKQLSKL